MLGLGAVGDVAADALQFGRRVGVEADQAFAPGDPALADLLVVHAGAVGLHGDLTLLGRLELEAAADQLVARATGELAVGVVDERDRAVALAADDEVALRLEQVAGALLGVLQLPVAVGQRFVLRVDLANMTPQPAKAHVLHGQRRASDREQEAHAEGKGMRIVVLRTRADDEAERRGEGDGEKEKARIAEFRRG